MKNITNRVHFPALGRWIRRDTIEERVGFNLRGFVDNDSVNKWLIIKNYIYV
jgi:hypothetical protein